MSSSASRLAPPPRLLEGVRARRPDGELAPLELPLTPLLDTTVLTNARGEPAIQHELAAEIPSAVGIDVVMAFVRWSGVRPLLAALRRHCDEGRRVRLITTTYTNSTEARALDELAAIGVDVRVSYDTTTTRLHAKAWLFHRHRGATTAYIGSSNLTHSAQVTGLEWNVRVSGLRNPDVVSKMTAVFESYWESDDFVPYDRAEFAERTAARRRRRPAFELPPTEIHLRPFQERLLEQIEVARRHGRHRNLLVAATGTGKTVMAAVDYVAAAAVAAAGAAAVRGAPTGDPGAEPGDVPACAAGCERSVSCGSAQHRPQRFEHVFASIQSLNAVGLECTRPDALRCGDRRRVPPRCSTVVPSAARARRNPSSCSGSRRRRNAPTASTCSATSTGGSQPSCGSGTRSTSSTSCRSPTTASTTGST